MKTNIVIVSILATLCLQSVSAQVTIPSAPTLEQTADGFARSKVVYWKGGFSFYGVTNGVTNAVLSKFTMQMVEGRWGFTQMQINSVDLPIDPANPLWELPPYLAGVVQNFYLYLWGYDVNQQVVRDGNYNSMSLGPNDEIPIIIYLQTLQVHVPYVLHGGQTVNNTAIVSSDGRNFGGWYDNQTQSFVAFYDPATPPASWLIIDTRNGAVIGSVPFRFDGQSPTQQVNNGYGLSMQNQNNIPELNLDNLTRYYGYLAGIPADHVINRGGTNFAGKFVIAHVSSTNHYLQSYVSGLRVGSVVEAWGLNSVSGALELVQRSVITSSWQLGLSNITGHSAYKIVVIGLPQDSLAGMAIEFYETENQWSTTDGGKG